MNEIEKIARVLHAAAEEYLYDLAPGRLAALSWEQILADPVQHGLLMHQAKAVTTYALSSNTRECK